MSEALLRNIMQLFAILGKLELAPNTHRPMAEKFLEEQVSLEDREHWLRLYDAYLEEAIARRGLGPARLAVRDSTRLLLICTHINEELTQRQKTMVLFTLFGIISNAGLAGAELVAEEAEFLTSVSDVFNISQSEFKKVEAFALSRPLAAGAEQDEDMVYIAEPRYLPSRRAKHIATEEMEGYVAVMRMPAIGMYLVRYTGASAMYLNGMAMQGGTIYSFDSGASLRTGSKLAPIYYSDVVSKFMEEQEQDRLTFEAREITFRFSNGRLGLHPFSLSEYSGNMIGLMGPSGAGKSTLLEVLNGNLRPTTGQVLINGKDLYAHKGLFKGVIGYVPQDDLLIEELTVFENMYYAAKLCFGEHTHTQLVEVVVKTLASLGLSHIARLRVGSPMSKTISGGERKRVNIGLELLRAPQVLFVDEPTSGLSSRDSVNVMELLKQLSETGKLVFVVIHQPSSDIFKMFDKLAILDTGGYPIYYGNPVEAIRYFKARVNHVHKDGALCQECGNVNPEQLFDIVETRTVTEYGRHTSERKFSPAWWNSQYHQHIQPQRLRSGVAKALSVYKKAPIARQLATFIQRDVVSKLNNQQYLAINLLEAPALALLLAYVFRYYKVDELTSTRYTFQDNDNIMVYLFISIIVALFLGLTVSAEEIFKDRKILKREAFLHLSRHAYFTSKVLILFTLSAIQCALFVWIGNSILDIRDFGWQHWAVLFSTACFANMLGLNISSAFNSAITIYILIPILLIPQLVLGGLVIKFDQINPALREGEAVPLYGEVMASRWAFEALAVSQYKDNPYEQPLYAWDLTLAQMDYKMNYLLPVLEAKAEYCEMNLGATTPAITQRMDRDLAILRPTLAAEALQYPMLAIHMPAALSAATYTAVQKVHVRQALTALRARYNYVFGMTDRARNKYVVAQTATPDKAEAYVALSRQYTNSALTDLVKNSRSQERITQEGDHLVQKVFPIFHQPEAGHGGLLGFRTHFFAPQKLFAGHVIDTLYFNLAMIWAMSLLLYAMLYHGTLTRFMRAFSTFKR